MQARRWLCALAAMGAAGCGEDFPQYTGRYQLASATYSDPGFVGELRLPDEIVVDHRMRYEGCCFNHYLRLELVPGDGAVSGAVGGSLTSLTYEDEHAWPNE